MINNELAKEITSVVGGCYLDKDNILWRHVDGEWIGKRSVFTKDYRCSWLENTTVENIKSWMCGDNKKEDIDYQEIFRR